MQYAVELYFDKETETKLLELARVIAEKKISTKFLEWKTRPHLTLACFNDVEETKCIERLNEFAQKHNVMPAMINSIGIFNDTRTIFVSPIMNSKMYQLHRELHESLKEFDSSGWEWYCPDDWVPHCTVALTLEDEDDAFYKACDLVLHEFKKLCGKFVSIGLVKITFPVEEIYTVKLGTEEITYEKLTSKNFNKCSLDQFVRHQVVKECRRNIEGEWKLVPNAFVENWPLEKCREIAEKMSSNLDGTMIDFGAFKGTELVGYITLGKELFGTKKQYLEVVEFEVSEPYRNHGIGKQLFQLACEAARAMNAKKLYISAHSSKESQAAYHKLGCKLAEEQNPVNVEKEPYDVPLEYCL